ncbi:hypothetical protein AB0B86_13090 [Micromonospora sp. NPDC049047]|uniref:hypothetical protein n=1 Tax=Micromonospora sp. NPDC049047 TaxID=3155645 RepID=UPI0033FD95BE
MRGFGRRGASAQGTLATTGETLSDQLTAFEQACAAYEGAWGDDTIGTYIGTAYTAVSAWAFDCWHSVAEELVSAGDDLVGMGEAYEQAESDIRSMITAIGEGLS